MLIVLRTTELFGEQVLDEHIDRELVQSLKHGFILEEESKLFLSERQSISHL